MIILATTSPRRVEIFKRLGFSFKAVPPLFDESTYTTTIPLPLLPIELAYEKAVSISKQFPNNLIIGFDTIVFLKNKIFGKPKNIGEAVDFLQEMSGIVHEVYL